MVALHWLLLNKCNSTFFIFDLPYFSTACQPGYYSLGGQKQCTVCDEGYYCEYLDQGQILCQPGFYSQPGSTNCTACEAGYYCPETLCKLMIFVYY